MRHLILALGLLFARPAHSFTTVTVSSAAPAGTEALFIAQATSTFNASFYVNPLFANTYQIVLYGPQPSNFTIIKDSETYSFIFGQGILNERSQDLNNLAGVDSNCDASPYCVGISSMVVPSNYKTYSSTYTIQISSATCQAIVCRIAGDIYQQDFVPTLINAP